MHHGDPRLLSPLGSWSWRGQLLLSHCQYFIDKEGGAGVSWAHGPVTAMCLLSSLPLGPAVFFLLWKWSKTLHSFSFLKQDFSAARKCLHPLHLGNDQWPYSHHRNAFTLLTPQKYPFSTHTTEIPYTLTHTTRKHKPKEFLSTHQALCTTPGFTFPG